MIVCLVELNFSMLRLREFGVDDGYRMVQEILHNLELFLLSKQTKI